MICEFIHKPGEGYTLKVSSGGLSTTSNAFTMLPSCYGSHLVVTTTADSGAGSLRQAINDTCDGGAVTFNIPNNDAGYDPTTKQHTIKLISGVLQVNRSVTIDAAGANSVIVDGNNQTRILSIGGNATVVINGLTMQKGVSGGDNGGAISNQNGTLTLNNCVLRHNHADVSGGAIENRGTLTMNGCRLADNGANALGGAIYNAGLLTLDACSLISNSVSSDGGGIANESGTVRIDNTLFNGNSGLSGRDQQPRFVSDRCCDCHESHFPS